MNAERVLELILGQDKASIQEELLRGLDPNLVCAGQPILLWSCSSAEDIAWLLIEKGADPNQSGLEGETPLMVACYCGNKSLVQRLLQVGASSNKADESGATALMYGAKGGHVGVIAALLAHQVDVDARDEHGRNALHWAVMEGDNEEAVNLLLGAGASRDAFASGLSPADYAERLGRTACAAALRSKQS